MFRLSRPSLTLAIRHLCKFGDTDVFPHLPEIAFLRERGDAALQELMDLDLDTYAPYGAVEALGPKSRLGFRIVHQSPLVETILLLGAVIEIAPRIEDARLPSGGFEAFSHRFYVGDDGRIFAPDRTYKAWLTAQLDWLSRNPNVVMVVSTDIADFYSRINFHRLENSLNEIAPGHGAVRYIKKQLQVIRAKQSFGLPVGGVAARLLAELALHDTDRMLADSGIAFTRFVDDFRLFLTQDQSQYDALASLSEHLSASEGLTLNAAKTHVLARREFVELVRKQTSEVTEEVEELALDALTTDLYFNDSADEEEFARLSSVNLLGMLDEEVSRQDTDVGRIRVLFRALKVVRPPEAIEYVRERFDDLVMYARELALLMQELQRDDPDCFAGLSDRVMLAITSAPATSIQVLRTWLLELFVRQIVPVNGRSLRALLPTASLLDRRQLNLIRGLNGEASYFRRWKTRVGEIAEIERWTFLWGAACMPADEYKSFIASVGPRLSGPLAALYLKWLVSEHGTIKHKLSAMDHALED